MDPLTPPPTTRSSRSTPPADPRAAAPFLRWDDMVAYLREPAADGASRFRQGDHVAILGPTGAGKTHIALDLADLRDYSIAVACKASDPLIEDTLRRGYWLMPGRSFEVPYVDGRPMHRRIVFWPRLGDKEAAKLPPAELLRTEKAIQKPAVASALGYVRLHGKWCLILDEGTWICRDLNLQRDVDAALMHFRTLDASLIILGQRPSWMGQYVLSQPTHLFLFQTAHTEDLKSLGDIAGVDTKLVQHLVRNLDADRHEALYVNTRERTLYRTIASPRR